MAELTYNFFPSNVDMSLVNSTEKAGSHLPLDLATLSSSSTIPDTCFSPIRYNILENTTSTYFDPSTFDMQSSQTPLNSEELFKTLLIEPSAYINDSSSICNKSEMQNSSQQQIPTEQFNQARTTRADPLLLPDGSVPMPSTCTVTACNSTTDVLENNSVQKLNNICNITSSTIKNPVFTTSTMTNSEAQIQSTSCPSTSYPQDSTSSTTEGKLSKPMERRKKKTNISTLSEIDKAAERRRRNRESSSRCYYNRKRIIDSLDAQISAEKHRLTSLYDRALELRHENARLKRDVVTLGIPLPAPRRMTSSDQRSDSAVQLRGYLQLLGQSNFLM